MDLKKLRLDMMKSKKTNPERAKVLQAILGTSQLIAKEDGNRDVTSKDIIAAAKKEAKLAKQSKDSGAPYIEETFEICAEFLPKMMNEQELETVIKSIIENLTVTQEKSFKLIGQVMKILKNEYTDLYDGGMANKITKKLLS